MALKRRCRGETRVYAYLIAFDRSGGSGRTVELAEVFEFRPSRGPTNYHYHQ
ncbi:hypothetical protein AK812_SmicGene47960, partial [Symbiodinium microadriaticum]